MTKRILFLFVILVAIFTISCDPPPTCDYVEIINNSDYSITWMVIIDAETGLPVLSERDDELIAKNGGSKSYDPINSEAYIFIVCVQAENTSELMCSTRLKLICGVNCNKRTTLIWNGSNDPAWQP